MFEQNKTGHFWDFIVFWDIDGFGRCPCDEAFSRRAHMARMHKVGCADALGARRAGALVQREKDEGARTCAYSLFGRRSLFLFPLFFFTQGKEARRDIWALFGLWDALLGPRGEKEHHKEGNDVVRPAR